MKPAKEVLGTLSPLGGMVATALMSTIETCFMVNGEIKPAMHGHDYSGKAEVITGFELSDRTRPQIWARLRQMRKKRAVTAFIAEVWMAHYKGKPGPEEPGFVRPSEDPDRKEQMMITLWDGQRTVSFYCDIKRNPDSLGEWMVMYDSFFPEAGQATSLGGAMVEGEGNKAHSN